MKAEITTKLESHWKKLMVLSVRDRGWYGRRIEDQFTVGQPDLVFVAPFGAVFAEAKRFDYNTFKPSPRQYIEMGRIANAGGVALLVGVSTVTNTHYLKQVLPGDPAKGATHIGSSDVVAQMQGEKFSGLLARWYHTKVKK